MGEKKPYDVEWFIIQVTLKADYTLAIPAGSKEEAVMSAYSRRIPVDSLHNVEKDVVKVMKIKQQCDRIELETLQ